MPAVRICTECCRWVCNPCVADAANDNDPGIEPLYVATDRELRSTDAVVRLARRLRDRDLVQHQIPWWIVGKVYGHEGPILWGDGRPFISGDPVVDDRLIDDAFGEDARRWFGDLLKFADEPPRQRPQERILPRLRITELALRIHDLD